MLVTEAWQCDCYPIREILAPFETLPERACLRCRTWSVRNWFLQGVSEQPGPRVAAPLGDGRYTEPIRTDRRLVPPWPLRVAHSNTVLVVAVRQWIEVEDEALDERLRGLPAWAHLVDVLREVTCGPTEAPGSAIPWEVARQQLQLRGFPNTPGMCGYALKQANPAYFPGETLLPTRGLVVTSLGLEPGAAGEAVAAMVSTVSGSAWWADTEALLKEAGRTMRAHRNWWKRLCAAPPPRIETRGRKKDPG